MECRRPHIVSGQQMDAMGSNAWTVVLQDNDREEGTEMGLQATQPRAFARENYQPDKLDELILYVAGKSADDPSFGKTKLNKILFFSDFQAYRQLGRSITGSIYWRLPQGPCPQQLLPALQRLGDDIELVEEPTLVGVRSRPIAKRQAEISKFDAPEIALVDEVMDRLNGLSAKAVSELSHEHLGWQIVADQQEIPYAAAMCAPVELEPEILDWVEEVAQDVGLVGASPMQR